MSEKMSYTEAFEELQRLVNDIESGEISVDLLAEKVKKGRNPDQNLPSKTNHNGSRCEPDIERAGRREKTRNRSPGIPLNPLSLLPAALIPAATTRNLFPLGKLYLSLPLDEQSMEQTVGRCF